MADDHVTFRLDEASAKALQFLMRGGASRSDAIRRALVDAARRRRAVAIAAEAARLANDPRDREEMAEVAELMEDLRAPR